MTLDRTYITFYDFDTGQSQVSGAVPAVEMIRRRADMDVRAEEEKARLLMDSTTQSKCQVCTAAAPCLFDLLSDPGERIDVATAHPDIVARLQAKLKTFAPYIGTPMTPHQYEQYECVKDIRPWWGNFSGPCCKRKATPV